MKRIGKICLFTLFVSYGADAAYTQVDNIEDLLRGGIDDATILIQEYLNPVGRGFTAALNNGWYSTARPHNFLGFDITILATGAITPDSDRTFDISGLSLNHIQPLNPGSSVTPTAMGSGNDGPEVEILADNPLGGGGKVVLDTLSLPRGVGFRYVPAPMIQASVGLMRNTEVMLRFFPEIESKSEFGKFKLFGLGIKHDLAQWFRKEDDDSFDLSLMAAFTTLQGKVNLDLPPEEELTPTGKNYNDQRVQFDAIATTINLLISKKIFLFTIFGSVGVESGNLDLSLKGTYPVTAIEPDPNNPGSYQKAIMDLDDPIELSFNNPNKLRASAGIQLHLAVLALQLNYTFGEYSSINGGVGINIK